MTDYTHLIARLRLSQTGGIHYEAADALEAQARRIEDLIDENRHIMHSFMRVDLLRGEQADRIEKLKAAMLRIGQPGKQIVYCRDGHEETVLLARAALGEKE
jgi:hypothetical protein